MFIPFPFITTLQAHNLDISNNELLRGKVLQLWLGYLFVIEAAVDNARIGYNSTGACLEWQGTRDQFVQEQKTILNLLDYRTLRYGTTEHCLW